MRHVTRWTGRLVVLAMLAIGALLLTTHARVQPVLTGSMTPTYPVGTLVATTPVDSATLRVGEVVLFTPPEPWGTPTGGPVLHRVVALTPGPDGRVQVRTKGDANPAMDPWTLDAGTSSFSELRASSVTAGRALTLLRASTRGPAVMVWAGLALLWLVHAQRPRRAAYRPRHAMG